MNTTFTFTVDIADVIPAITGIMIFVSVLLAGTKQLPKIRLAWMLGLGSQVLLVGFGVLTGHYAFGMHLLVASAFAVNIWKFRPDRSKSYAQGGVVPEVTT